MIITTWAKAIVRATRKDGSYIAKAYKTTRGGNIAFRRHKAMKAKEVEIQYFN